MPPKFADVAVQDLLKAPLGPGEQIAVGVVGLLNHADQDGSNVWKKFKMRVTHESKQAFKMPNGIAIHQRPMVGGRQRVPSVNLADIPMFLSTVLFRCDVERTLKRPDLLHALVRHGIQEEAAKALISKALAMVAPETNQLANLFGGTDIVRFTKIPESGITVYSALDIVQAARKCDSDQAQRVVYKIFKKYHSMDLEKEFSDKVLSERTLSDPRDPDLQTSNDTNANGVKPYWGSFQDISRHAQPRHRIHRVVPQGHRRADPAHSREPVVRPGPTQGR
jgi:hypothetical protein